MSIRLSFLEVILIIAVATLVAAAAAPQAPARRTSDAIQDRAALDACRRTSESELRRIACAERLARLDAGNPAARKKN
ncbi:MAG TPA: hypothetical protein VHL99_04920 [Candidatus Binatia bacterium]|jgi:hypothetical protein|nr:hypothetical protein [Candidatus Binatia bacterium]